MDPIMWDPFRYKLGGRLLNSEMKEFLPEEGRLHPRRARRRNARHSQEVAAGRGLPHGGAWLSFQHCSEAVLREAFGPVIDRLAANGIDLTRQPIDAPIAHYHMGGMRAGADMQTTVPHLFAAGEAVGGANGANRLSGNAITEALTFGRRAGERAAALAAKIPMPAIEPSSGFSSNRSKINPAAEIVRLQKLMNEHVGLLRTQGGLERALQEIRQMCGDLPPRARVWIPSGWTCTICATCASWPNA